MSNLNKNQILFTKEEIIALLDSILSNTNESLREEMLEDVLTEINATRVERMPGEIFKLIPETSRFYASNFGRILKITEKGESLCRLTRSKNKTGKYYNDVLLELKDGSKIKVRATRAIAKAWLDKDLSLTFNKQDKLIVDHINNNSEDNRIGNLRICTQQQNIRNAMFEQGCLVGKPMAHCYAYNFETGEVLEFKNTKDLCEHFYGSRNGGYFNKAYKERLKVKKQWLVGYKLEELYNIQKEN